MTFQRLLRIGVIKWYIKLNARMHVRSNTFKFSIYHQLCNNQRHYTGTHDNGILLDFKLNLAKKKKLPNSLWKPTYFLRLACQYNSHPAYKKLFRLFLQTTILMEITIKQYCLLCLKNALPFYDVIANSLWWNFQIKLYIWVVS